MTSISLGFVQDSLHLVFFLYTGLMLVHLVVQVGLAHRTYRRSALRAVLPVVPSRLPSVDVVVPVYNENPADLGACFASIAGQDYRGTVEVYVVDDGSPNREELRAVYAAYGALPGWHVLLPERNGGKRAAQDHAVRIGSGELVVTMTPTPRSRATASAPSCRPSRTPLSAPSPGTCGSPTGARTC